MCFVCLLGVPKNRTIWYHENGQVDEVHGRIARDVSMHGVHKFVVRQTSYVCVSCVKRAPSRRNYSVSYSSPKSICTLPAQRDILLLGLITADYRRIWSKKGPPYQEGPSASKIDFWVI